MALRIKELLKDKDITQNQLAEMLGITHGAMSATINGNPRLSTLEKIAEVLDVPITDLFESISLNATCPHCGKPLKINIE